MALGDDIEAAIRRLTAKRLYIGIPMDKDPRQGEPIGNASLGYIQEFGSPAKNIPARPFLVPGVETALPQIEAELKTGAIAALNADPAGVDRAFARAGVRGVNSVTRRIQAGIPPPLKDATVAARRRRTRGSKYRRKAVTAADVTPLLDTGALLRSITYVIR
jgi:hypothetical protein